eukprot:jgi/Chlat1/4805/Chrsp31S04795
MAPATLYAPEGSRAAQKAQIAARYAGVQLKTSTDAGDAPAGKPSLKLDSGSVFGEDAIARYIARSGAKDSLLGPDKDMHNVDQWLELAQEVTAALDRWVGPVTGHGAYNKQTETAAIADVKKGLAAFDAHLKGSTYLAGDRVTLADILATVDLLAGFTTVFEQSFRDEYPHLVRWFMTLVHQPNLSAVLGDVTLCEKAATHSAPKKEKEKEKEKPAQEKPAAASPAPAPATPAGNDEEDEPAPKPKAKNPLDLLPPSKMVMDEWKRLYSNTPAKTFREVAIGGFWNMYDPEGYCLFFSEYKYNDENTVNYVTMNKVSGFLQRCDLIRKHAFGVMCILGEGPFEITGAWLFRGSDIPQALKDEVYDTELYEWKRIDINDPAQKARLEDMWVQEDKIDGKVHIEAKVFK